MFCTVPILKYSSMRRNGRLLSRFFHSTTSTTSSSRSDSNATLRGAPQDGDANKQQESTSSRGRPGSPSFLAVLGTELRKIGPVLSYTARHLSQVMQGTDGAPQDAERERLHKAAYRQALAQQHARARDAHAAAAAAVSNASLRERVRFHFQGALESLKASTSRKSGVVAIVQHCAASHAAEVAVEQGIDVKSVTVVLEKSTTDQRAIAEDKVVGYIEAPQASDAELYEFAHRLQRACPAARAMEGRIEWRRRGDDKTGQPTQKNPADASAPPHPADEQSAPSLTLDTRRTSSTSRRSVDWRLR